MSRTGFDDMNNLLVGDELFNVLDNVRDRGILVDSKLTFTSHIDSVIAKAKQRIYLIFKSFESRRIALLIFAYKTYILPILDFFSSVWSPHKLTDIDRLEDVHCSTLFYQTTQRSLVQGVHAASSRLPAY